MGVTAGATICSHYAPPRPIAYLRGTMSRCRLVAAAVTAACGCGTSAHEPPVSVELMGFDGFAYSAPLTLGGQPFQVQIDTGSTTTAVAASACTTCGVSPEYSAG